MGWYWKVAIDAAKVPLKGIKAQAPDTDLPGLLAHPGRGRNGLLHRKPKAVAINAQCASVVPCMLRHQRVGFMFGKVITAGRETQTWCLFRAASANQLPMQVSAGMQGNTMNTAGPGQGFSHDILMAQGDRILVMLREAIAIRHQFRIPFKPQHRRRSLPNQSAGQMALAAAPVQYRPSQWPHRC